MAFSAISVDNITPVFEVFIEENKVNDGSFAFYLTNVAGEEGS
jgi:hypothetical protein